MLEWKKQILRQKRFSQDEDNKDNVLTRQSQLYEFIEQMQNHFCRLFSFLVRLRNNPTQNTETMDFSITQLPQLTIPEKLSNKQSNKLTHSLYRRLKMVVVSFEAQGNLKLDLDKAFQQSKSAQISLLQFYNRCCKRVSLEIKQFRKQKKEENPNFRISNRYSDQKQKQKPTHKKISQILCSSIYSILDLQYIEASYLYFEAKDLQENIDSIYGKIKVRNKKNKKFINQYRDGYNLMMQKRSQALERSWFSRSSLHNQKKQIRIVTRNLSNQGLIRPKKYSVHSQIRSISKNKSPQKPKIKLQPLTQTQVQRTKLKLLR